jgi:hypothetical protein
VRRFGTAAAYDAPKLRRIALAFDLRIPVAMDIQVQADAVHVDDLTIDRKVVIEYLQNIAPEKQLIALMHAIEVGVTELLARRERFRH